MRSLFWVVLCSGFENRVFPQAGLTRSAGTYASGARPRTRIRTAAAPSPWPFGSRGRSLAAGSPRSTMVQSRQNQFFRPGRPESCSVSQSLPLGGRCIRLPSFVAPLSTAHATARPPLCTPCASCPRTPDPHNRQTMNGTGSGSLVTQAIGAPNTRRQTEAQGGAAGGGAADGVRSSAADAAHGQLQLLNDRVYHANGLS